MTQNFTLINQGVKSGWIIWPQKVHVCRALSSAVNIIDCGSIIWNKKNQTPRRRKGPGSNLRLLLVLIWDFCGFNFACTDSAPDLYLETFSFWNYWLSSRFASTNFLSGEWWVATRVLPPKYIPDWMQTCLTSVGERYFKQHIWNKEGEKMPCTECMESPPVQVAQTAHNKRTCHCTKSPGPLLWYDPSLFFHDDKGSRLHVWIHADKKDGKQIGWGGDVCC